MRFRKLRIAWSAVFGLLCLLMVAWWIRGYWWQDDGFVKFVPSQQVQYSAGEGRMCLWFEHSQTNKWYGWDGTAIQVRTGPTVPNRIPWFDVGFWPHMTRVYAAHCFLTMVLGSLAAVVWCPRRFSIRGILITTAVIATILSVIMWVDNRL
jgi:hypothetical protein